MSFAREIENNLRSVDREHLPSNLLAEIHQHSNGGWKNGHQLVLPPMNRFGGVIRCKPQSGFSQSTLISSGGMLDYHINSAGYVEKAYLEIELTVANATTILPHYLIDRIEILSTEGNPVSTIYGDNVYFAKLHKTLEECTRESSIENIGTTYNGVSVATGSIKRILLHLPTFLDAAQMKLNVIRDRVTVRISFSPLGVTSGAAGDITVSLCDLILHTQQLSAPLESLENSRKFKSPLNFRFLNPVRAASQTLSLAASSQYDIRLTSANNLSAFIVFVIRAAPLAASNINTFQAIDSFEFLDKDNTVVGVKTSVQQHMLLSKAFNGDILNHRNIYCIPFALSIEGAMSGQQTGFYSCTSNEIIRIYTNSTISSGSYRVDVYTYDYCKLTVNNGSLSVSK